MVERGRRSQVGPAFWWEDVCPKAIRRGWCRAPPWLQVVEQMTRESNFLDVDRVMGYLMDAKLADSRPLINICDRYDRVTDLTAFLYKNNMRNYIEGYVQKVNPGKTPQVVGGLLDSQADEKFMSDLIMSVRPLLLPPRRHVASRPSLQAVQIHSCGGPGTVPGQQWLDHRPCMRKHSQGCETGGHGHSGSLTCMRVASAGLACQHVSRAVRVHCSVAMLCVGCCQQVCRCVQVRSLLPVAELCAEVEKRNKLKLLDKFLKVLVEEGSQDPEVHNAMGKILIDANSNPEHFLQSNPFYQPAVVGKYCEKRCALLSITPRPSNHGILRL